MGGIPTAALNNCMTFDSDMTFTSLSLSFLIYKMGAEESIKGGYHLPGAAESVLLRVRERE